MTKEQKNELKQVLLGKTQPDQDGNLVPMQKGDYRLPLGITDGAGAVRFLGISSRSRCLRSELSEANTRKALAKALRDIGRRVVLREQPQASVCLLRFVATRPALLVFDYRDGQPIVTAWAGRGLTGWLSKRRALARLSRALPQQIALSNESVPEEAGESGGRKSRRKKSESNSKEEPHESQH